MVSRTVAVVPKGDASKIPRLLRFPLLVLLSLTLSSLLYSFAAQYTAGDLASVSRSLDQWWEVGALIGWRTFELGLGWFGNYDGYDLASLTLLSHGPPLYLLGAFYEIQPATILSSLLIDCLTTYIPFRLLRPLSRAHAASVFSPSSVGVVPNREIVTDLTIQTVTTFLAGSIYSVVLYSAFVTYLPVFFVTYFADIPSVAAAHSASYISLLPMNLFFGLAAKSFIFTPATAASPSSSSPSSASGRRRFDPVAASLAETFWYNVWGYSPRVKVVIQRTLALVLVSGVNTFVQSFVTIEGIEVIGAVAYSAVWATAAAVTGAVLGFVGAV